MPNPIDLTNRRFGRLLVLEQAPHRGKERYWLCRCDCGASVVVARGSLMAGRQVSCCCHKNDILAAQKRMHGHSGLVRTRTYNTWASMVQRCVNPKATKFENYGGRGITVCQRWRESFENFYADMGERPESKTLDRIDNDGHYEPGNCRWATLSEQRNNMRKLARRIEQFTTDELIAELAQRGITPFGEGH